MSGTEKTTHPKRKKQHDGEEEAEATPAQDADAIASVGDDADGGDGAPEEDAPSDSDGAAVASSDAPEEGDGAEAAPDARSGSESGKAHKKQSTVTSNVRLYSRSVDKKKKSRSKGTRTRAPSKREPGPAGKRVTHKRTRSETGATGRFSVKRVRDAYAVLWHKTPPHLRSSLHLLV